MMTPEDPTPDVIFAQKATAIVQAAGMDPRVITLDSFRSVAPIVFCRAYTAIYKEDLLCNVTESTSPSDQILNAQLVIDGLWNHTKNPLLAKITGLEIYQGNHQVIGIIVGVMFAEGQRMWLNKMRTIDRTPLAQSGSSNDARTHSPGSSPAKNGTSLNMLYSDIAQCCPPGAPADVSSGKEDSIQNDLQGLDELSMDPEVTPEDLAKLHEKISRLERELDRIKSARNTGHRGSSKDGRVRTSKGATRKGSGHMKHHR